MIGAGTIISPIIKVATTVAILAAVYFFIVKPVLDTTEKATIGIGQGISGTEGAELDVARRQAESRADGFLAGANPWRQARAEVRDCIKQAGSEVGAMQRCASLAQRIQGASTNRNVALSQADGIALQGREGDARRIRQCVTKAGFKSGAMSKCRALAGELLVPDF